MIEVRRAESHTDLEAWRSVRQGVEPDDRTLTVAELREWQTPDRVLLLAELDGAVAGCGIGQRSSFAGRAFVLPRVLPETRRHGVGTALLHELAAHADRLETREVVSHVDARDVGSLAFSRRFGFAEVDRQVEQVKTLVPGAEPAPAFPAGVDVTTVGERPELLREAYALAVEGHADMATPFPASITLEDWLREEATHPHGSFVALAGGEVIGYSGLVRDGDVAARAEDGLTVVRRDWRGRGLALALKRAELAWAAANGIAEVSTWTQRGNDAMRATNERLGYAYRHVELTLLAALPLTSDGG